MKNFLTGSTVKNCFILDLDDTLANSTVDLKGEPARIPHLTLVPGAIEFLKKHHRHCVLLTAGDKAEQEQKIDVLGIRKCFKKIIIVKTPEDKKEKLRELVTPVYRAEDPKVTAAPVWSDRAHITVIGDRLDVEIRTGNELGCTTVRIKLPEGRHSSMLPNLSFNEVPHHEVHDFTELLKLFP